MRTLTKALLLYYCVINLVLFLVMGYDKQQAQKEKWRVSENTLFILGLLGGGIGGFLGMKIWRHKTKKVVFYIVFAVSLLLHIGFSYFLWHILR